MGRWISRYVLHTVRFRWTGNHLCRAWFPHLYENQVSCIRDLFGILVPSRSPRVYKGPFHILSHSWSWLWLDLAIKISQESAGIQLKVRSIIRLRVTVCVKVKFVQVIRTTRIDLHPWLNKEATRTIATTQIHEGEAPKHWHGIGLCLQ